jgi:hypothetical protein
MKVLVLTNRSEGHTFVATVGEEVVVTVTGGRTFRNGDSITDFVAVGHGSVTLSATGYPICAPGTDTGCPQFVVLWTAGVVVPVVDPPAPS